ncbi:3523_t:CDS:1 [Entrophospora sp. SA101]|nr:3517_t:CDS:1 [Entrophospora sp. SA101]CAJ0646262.1 3523_t:CDS:1 [Entrophospora sp. SA101]
MTVSTTSAQHRNNTHQLQHRHQLNHPLQRRNNHQLHHPNGHHHLHIHNQKLSDTGIPVSFILQELYHLSPIFYNNKSKCAIQLHITGLPKIFHIHKEYLIFQSICFRKIFETLSGDIIHLHVPSPETFEWLLEYLYTGNSDKLYDRLRLENYNKVWKNVEFLGLGSDVRAIILAFYQNEIQPESE